MLFTEHVGITVSDLEVSDRFYSSASPRRGPSCSESPSRSSSARTWGPMFRDPDENNLQLIDISARSGGLPLPS